MQVLMALATVAIRCSGFERLKTIEELDLQREQLEFMKAQATNADKAYKKMFIVALVSAVTALVTTIATLLHRFVKLFISKILYNLEQNV